MDKESSLSIEELWREFSNNSSKDPSEEFLYFYQKFHEDLEQKSRKLNQASEALDKWKAINHKATVAYLDLQRDLKRFSNMVSRIRTCSSLEEVKKTLKDSERSVRTDGAREALVRYQNGEMQD